MTPDEARQLIATTTTAWMEDVTTSVVWSGEHEGRRGIRMAQTARDYTTVWFSVGERTVGLEAYLLPSPPRGRDEVFRQCLVRNWRSWPALVAMHRDGDLYVVARIPLDAFDEDKLDEAVGAVYELVELSFRPLVLAGFARG